MQKLIFDYSKNYNEFFFISNLACWHFSCRKNYNDAWLKDNPLNKKEAATLEKVRPIFQKYGFGENYPGLAFLGDKISWDRLEKKPSEEERQFIGESFRIFDKRYNEIWKKGLSGLKFWKKELRRIVNQKEAARNLALFKKILNSRQKKRIEVYLLISPPGLSAGGQALSGRNIITLECSGAAQRDEPKLLSILSHELIHIFQRDYMDFLVEKYIAKKRLMSEYPDRWPELYMQKWGPKSLFRETIATCLPRIFLKPSCKERPKVENKVFKRPTIFWEALDYSIRKNQPMIEKYLKEGKIIDEKLLNEIWHNFELLR